MTVAAFVFAATNLLVPMRDHDALDRAIIARVDAELPLFADDSDKIKTAAWLVAIAFRESSLRLDAVGDHGQSLCAFQLGRSSGGTDAMLTDADLCVSHAFGMLRTSMRLCRAFPLAWFAAGGDAAKACASPHAQRLSRDRLALAVRLVRDVQVRIGKGEGGPLTPAVPDALAGPFFCPRFRNLPGESARIHSSRSLDATIGGPS